MQNRKSETFFAELVQHLPAVWRFALSLSAVPDVADDLSQATALRAMERRHQFREGTNQLAWLLTICRSVWLNEVRSRAVREYETIHEGGNLQLADLRPGVETNILAAQVFSKVMKLPVAQRETVLLVFVEGFSYSEAAEILEIPIGTVMSRLSAARAKLRHLGDLQPEEKQA